MKKLHLLFNKYSDRYIFVDGANPYDEKRRTEYPLSTDSLLKKIAGRIDSKRSTLFCVDKDVPSVFRDELRAHFRGSKVEISLEDNRH